MFTKLFHIIRQCVAGALLVGSVAAPAVIPMVAPQFVPMIPVAQAMCGSFGTILVGPDVWNSWRAKKIDGSK